jgi:predicted metal-dependent phosphoesterase TrpH
MGAIPLVDHDSMGRTPLSCRHRTTTGLRIVPIPSISVSTTIPAAQEQLR